MSYGTYSDIPHLKAKVGKIKIVKVIKTEKDGMTILRVVTTKINIVNLDKQREKELKKKEEDALKYFDQVMAYCYWKARPVQLIRVKQVQCLVSLKHLCHHEACMDADVIYQHCNVRPNPSNRKLTPRCAEGNCDTLINIYLKNLDTMDDADNTNIIDSSTTNASNSSTIDSIDSSTTDSMEVNCHRRNSWKTWFRRQFNRLLCRKA